MSEFINLLLPWWWCETDTGLRTVLFPLSFRWPSLSSGDNFNAGKQSFEARALN